MGLVPDVGSEKPVQRHGGAAGREREEPLADHREEHCDPPEQQPHHVRHREEETEESREPRAAAVVVQIERDRVLRRRSRRRGERRVGRRIRRCDEQDVRVRLRRVAEPVRGDVAQTVRHLAQSKAREPPEECGRQDDPAAHGEGAPEAPGRAAAVHQRQEEDRRNRKQEAGAGCQPRLPLRRVQLDVDRVPRLTEEPRKRVRCQREVGADVRRVANVGDVEGLQWVGRPCAHHRYEPLRDRGEEDRERPQSEPDEMRDRKEEPEEDREP